MESTKNYDMFMKYAGNRPVDRRYVDQLIYSISQENLLEQNPIIVNEYNEVIDGQHRLESAKVLQLPIFYVVRPGAGAREVVLLNNGRKNWKPEDYLRLYAEGQKKESYIYIQDFIKSHGFPLATSLLIIQGPFKEMKECAAFRDGDFTLKIPLNEIEELCSKVSSVVDLIKRHNIKPLHRFVNTSFIRPLVLFLSHDNLNWDLFQQKLEANWFKIGTRPSHNLYIEMFCEIYNIRNQNKIYFEAQDAG